MYVWLCKFLSRKTMSYSKHVVEDIVPFVQVTSYGGELKYKIFYDTRSSPRFQTGADVIMSGNGITVYTTQFTQPFVGVEATASVTLIEVKDWT